MVFWVSVPDLCFLIFEAFIGSRFVRVYFFMSDVCVFLIRLPFDPPQDVFMYLA